MSYLNQFVESIRFLGELEPEFFLNESAVEKAKQHFQELADKDFTANLIPILEQLAGQYIAHSPQNFAHICHGICDDFHHRISHRLDSAITIGAVSYLGAPIYDVSPDSIRQAVTKGFQPGEPLNLHVWLTFPDMTVLDLTIIPTIVDKGLIQPGSYPTPYVIWRDDQDSPFSYIPLLQDNNFATLVDQITVYA